MLAEYNGTTGAVVVQHVSLSSRTVGAIYVGGVDYFLSDRLSIRAVLDAAGNLTGRQSHLPFGEELGCGGDLDKRHFTSYERDSESGTDYAVNRQYSANVARFMRPDRFSGSYDYSNPQSQNRYSYVRNDAINATDPLGLCLCLSYYDEGADLRWVECYLCNPMYLQRHRQAGRGGGGNAGRPDKKPCQNVDGFDGPVNSYSASELDAASITVYGELSILPTADTRAEAEAIASVIFNRSAAIAAGTVSPGAGWGKSSSLIDVVSASGQFAGFRMGQEHLRDPLFLNEGEPNCIRLQTAGSAVAWLAANPDARKPYLYMCAAGHNRRPLDATKDVVINGNVFSTVDLQCH